MAVAVYCVSIIQRFDSPKEYTATCIVTYSNPNPKSHSNLNPKLNLLLVERKCGH